METDKFVIQVIPFETDDESERYKVVMQCINDFIGELKLDVLGIGKQLHQIWCADVFRNGTKKDDRRKIASLQINAVSIENEIKRIEKELKKVRQSIADSTRTDNEVVKALYQNVLKYSIELGIGSEATLTSSYLFTSNLKELSGAILHKTVFSFRLAYIIEIEKKLGLKLPIILDSPSGKEVDLENIKLMMDILKRDFSDHQTIIASIFEYDFNPLNKIEIVNRLIEIE